MSLTFELSLLALIFRKRPRLSLTLAFAAALVLLAASSGFVATALRSPLESRYPVLSIEDTPTADAIVVLGGSLASALPPRRGAELVDSSDRLLHAARLFRAGKAPLVLTSGGASEWADSEAPESDSMTSLLVEWGVPRDHIVPERGSRTTFENALETGRILAERGGRHVLLVTSAIHMPRAVATFRRAGVDVLPSPTDFSVVHGGRGTVIDLWPSPGALAGTTSALHEWYGLLYYRLRGWSS